MDSGPFIIFLDIDGVLVRFHENIDGDWFVANFLQPSSWDPVCLQNLHELCEKTGAKVVISSTWRFHYPLPDWWTKQFSSFGAHIECVGVTGRAERGFRGEEVAQWISSHSKNSGYICLDDDSDFYESQELIKINPELGLTQDDVQLALAYFESMK